MEESLKLYLENVTEEEADRLWEYLDGNPSAPQEMIGVLLDSHPTLRQQFEIELNETKKERIG